MNRAGRTRVCDDARMTTCAPMLLAALAAAPDPQALAARVQGYYEATRDLQARFVQTYTYAAFGRKQVSRGTFQVKKPGKLRWDYAEPERKVVVVNGSRLVQWEPAANQAYVDDRFDATAMSAAVSFLLGSGRLEAEFGLAVDDAGRLVLTLEGRLLANEVSLRLRHGASAGSTSS